MSWAVQPNPCQRLRLLSACILASSVSLEKCGPSMGFLFFLFLKKKIVHLRGFALCEIRCYRNITSNIWFLGL